MPKKRGKKKFSFDKQATDEIDLPVRGYIEGVRRFQSSTKGVRGIFADIQSAEPVNQRLREIDGFLTEVEFNVQKYLDGEIDGVEVRRYSEEIAQNLQELLDQSGELEGEYLEEGDGRAAEDWFLLMEQAMEFLKQEGYEVYNRLIMAG